MEGEHMATEIVPATDQMAVVSINRAALPQLVERAGGAARFAWDEFFYAEHHNPHTQAAYQRAVRRFLAWAEGQGVELAAITPGLVGQYLVGLGGSAAKRNQHLAALRGFFDRLVNRHVCILNPAASVKGVKEQVIEGKTPEITLEQARTLIRSVETGHVVGLRDRAILATLAYTVCRAGAVAKLRLGDFQHDGTQLSRYRPHYSSPPPRLPLLHPQYPAWAPTSACKAEPWMRKRWASSGAPTRYSVSTRGSTARAISRGSWGTLPRTPAPASTATARAVATACAVRPTPAPPCKARALVMGWLGASSGT
jgi:integrase